MSEHAPADANAAWLLANLQTAPDHPNPGIREPTSC